MFSPSLRGGGLFHQVASAYLLACTRLPKEGSGYHHPAAGARRNKNQGPVALRYQLILLPLAGENPRRDMQCNHHPATFSAGRVSRIKRQDVPPDCSRRVANHCTRGLDSGLMGRRGGSAELYAASFQGGI
jgi:hypothetical protein